MATKLPAIQNHIYEIRGQRVMFDFDLAALYKVQTRILNQAVKRNRGRFPAEFMFRLKTKEWNSLRSQIVILEKGRGRHPKYAPYVFTEYGVVMLASVLRSTTAVRVNIAIVRAFIALKEVALEYKELQKKISELEIRYNHKFSNIEAVIDFLIREKRAEIDQRNRKKIGFKE